MKPVVIVTGASGGLGSALTEVLLQQNWQVVAGTRSPNSAAVLQQLKQQYTTDLHIVKADVTNTEDLHALKHAAQQAGDLHALINNAGTANGKALVDASDQEVAEILHVNVQAPLSLTKLVFTDLQQNNGVVVNISSIVGSVAVPYLGVYSASKHALNAVTTAQYLENLHSTVRFRLIQPGPLTSKLCGGAITKAVSKQQESMRMGVEAIGRKHGVSTHKAAEIIVRSLQTQVQFKIIVIGFWTKVILTLEKIMPRGIFQRVLAWYYKIVLRRN